MEARDLFSLLSFGLRMERAVLIRVNSIISVVNSSVDRRWPRKHVSRNTDSRCVGLVRPMERVCRNSRKTGGVSLDRRLSDIPVRMGCHRSRDRQSLVLKPYYLLANNPKSSILSTKWRGETPHEYKPHRRLHKEILL